MADKYLKLASGRKQEQEVITTSAGAGDSGKIAGLDAAGRWDSTMMPVGVGADTASIVSSENLTAGDFVNIWDDAGTIKVRKADNTASGKEVDGFVLANVTAPAAATVYFEGQNNVLSALTLGARYYQDPSTPGGITSTAPSTSGNVVQYLGRAIAVDTISFEPDDGVILA